jgi:hypothetical protein
MLADVGRQTAISGVLSASRHVPKRANFNASVASYDESGSREGHRSADDGSESECQWKQHV